MYRLYFQGRYLVTVPPQLLTTYVAFVCRTTISIPLFYSKYSVKLRDNKKVLLRERKRHTARRVASARYAGVGGGEVPHPVMVGGYPIQSW